MNLTRKRIKQLLKEIEKNGRPPSPKKSTNNFCIIKLIFDTNVFDMKCSSIGDFMKKLRNGKIALDNHLITNRPKQNNRQYFNFLIDEGGYYNFKYDLKVVEINIYLDVIDGLDYHTEHQVIKSIISKIAPYKECYIGFNDKPLLDNTFRNLSTLNAGWSVFGNHYKNQIIK